MLTFYLYGTKWKAGKWYKYPSPNECLREDHLRAMIIILAYFSYLNNQYREERPSLIVHIYTYIIIKRLLGHCSRWNFNGVCVVVRVHPHMYVCMSGKQTSAHINCSAFDVAPAAISSCRAHICYIHTRACMNFQSKPRFLGDHKHYQQRRSHHR